MKKFKIRSIYAIIFVFILTLGIGFSAWIITHNIRFYPDYQIDAEWEKYLGGQSKFVGSGTLLPDTKNSSIVNVTSSNLGGYTVEYKLQTSNSFQSGSPTAAGEYHLRYTKGDEKHIITFYVVAKENYVCYIDSDTEANRYASIEEALSVAKANASANTIYTRINKYGSTNIDIIIRSDCEIGSGDTLYLQCGLDVTRSTKEKSSVSGSSSTSDGRNYGITEVDPINKANTKVVIDQGIILTNNGTIVVDGQISSGYGGSPSAGHTCGIDSNVTWTDYQTTMNTDNENVLYSVLCLDENAIINSYGNVYCYGFIFELNLNNSSELIMNSGTLYMPFILKDFKGGSAMYAIYKSIDEKHSSAFNEYSFENISCKTKITYNANLIAWGNLWANDDHNHTNINFISNNQSSNDNVIELTNSNGYTITKFNPDTQKLSLDIYGGADAKAMSLSINVGFTVKVSTDQVYFPISWRYNISFNKLKEQTEAVYSLPYRYKLMPGAELTVSEGAVLNIDELIAYTSYAGNESLMPGTKYPVIYQYGALAGTPVPSAKITNNGTINANYLAGPVYSNVNGAQMTITSDASITSYEPKQHSGSSFFASMAAWHEISEVLLIQLYKSNGVTKELTPAAKGLYTSKKYKDTDEFAGWFSSELTLYFLENGGIFDNTGVTEIYVQNVTSLGKKITADIISQISGVSRGEHYTFKGWYLDKEGTIPALDQAVYVSTYIYAIWQPVSYDITIEYVYNGCVENGTITDINGNEFTVFDTNKFTNDTYQLLNTPKHSLGYVFGGWYLDEECTQPISMFRGSDYADEKGKKIFGKWYPNGTETYTVNYEMVNANEVTLQNFTLTPSEVVSLDISKYIFPVDCFANNVNNDTTILIVQYFVGWYDSYDESTNTFGNPVDETGVKNILNQLYSSNADKEENDKIKQITLYGRWENKVEVILNEGTEDENTIWITPNLNFKLPSSNILSNEIEVWFSNATKNSSTFLLSGATYTSANLSITDNKAKLYSAIYCKTTIKVTNSNTSTTVSTNSGVVINSNKNEIVTNFSSSAISSTGYTCYLEKEKTVTFTATANSGYSEPKINNESSTKTITIGSDSTNITINSTAKKDSICVTSDTLITLADGTQVRVDQLKGNELLLVWDHSTGKYASAKIAYIVSHDETDILHKVVKMKFSDGSTIKIIGEHVFYDTTINKYVAIDEYNINDYITHKFLKYSEGGLPKEIELVGFETYEEMTRSFEVVTDKHLINFTNGILSTSAYLDPLLNVFELNEYYQYNQEQMIKDIETYGLYTYEDFEGLIDEKAFEMYNAQYLKIAVGKGYITWEEILELIDIYYNNDVKPL